MSKFMVKMASPARSPEMEKMAHSNRINHLRKAYEEEMLSYINRYVLDGRCIDEVFSVAQHSVVDDVIVEEWVGNHYVLEHIVDHEELFIGEAYTLACHKAIFNQAPKARWGARK